MVTPARSTPGRAGCAAAQLAGGAGRGSHIMAEQGEGLPDRIPAPPPSFARGSSHTGSSSPCLLCCPAHEEDLLGGSEPTHGGFQDKKAFHFQCHKQHLVTTQATQPAEVKQNRVAPLLVGKFPLRAFSTSQCLNCGCWEAVVPNVSP